MSTTKHISTYLNDIEEREYDMNPTIQTLVEIIREQKKLCESWAYNPTQRHAMLIFDEIVDWEVEI